MKQAETTLVTQLLQYTDDNWLAFYLFSYVRYALCSEQSEFLSSETVPHRTEKTIDLT